MMGSELNHNMMYEIMLKTEYKDLKALSQVNKEAYKIYKSEELWEKKYIQDYGRPEWKVEKWKTAYKWEYVKNNPKKIYNLVMNAEDCDPDVLLTIKAENREEAYEFIAHYCNSTNSYISGRLIDQYMNVKIMESNKLDTLCENYKTRGTLSGFLMRKAVKLYYFRPGYLYYERYDGEKYLDFLKYLYQNGYCIDKINEIPEKIYRQYFTANDIKTMLNIKSENDNNISKYNIELNEEKYYEI